jgi:hypothetical protein
LLPHLPPINTKAERGYVVFLPRLHISEHGSGETLRMAYAFLAFTKGLVIYEYRCNGATGPHRRILAYIRMLLIFSEIGRCATHLQFLPDIAAKWSDQMRDVVRILCDQSSWLKLGKLGRPRHFGCEIATAIPDVQSSPESLGAS